MEKWNRLKREMIGGHERIVNGMKSREGKNGNDK